MTDSATNFTKADDAPAGLCTSCGSVHLRRSKSREDDWGWMALLQFPVRCMTCLKRERIPVWLWLRAIPAHVAHSGQYAAKGTWQELTAESKPQEKPKEKDAA